MTEDVSVILAFAAGLLSFLSPCVLPLIPSYLSILGGVGLNGNSQTGQSAFSKGRLVKAAAGFVLGFSIVFITFGILISTTFFFAGDFLKYINWVAGILVIILGINIIFDFFSFFNYEKRPFLQKQMSAGKIQKENQGVIRAILSAFLAGAAFGAGWTPCIGPILTGILLMASQGGKTGTAVLYLAVYSAGLALPFILAAVFFDFFLKQASRLRSRLPLIRRISGILLIIIGLMILTGRYSALNIQIQRWIFSYIGWAEGKALPFRLIGKLLSWIQSF